jgi:nucleotide-binding universal stress UspA family protein
MAARIPSRKIRLIMVQPETTAPGQARQAASEGRAYLDVIAAPLRRQGRVAETEVVFADPGRQIVARSAMDDLVVMGSEDLGDVAAWVATHAPVPTMILHGRDRPAASSALERIVIAFDGSSQAESALPLAEKFATGLAVPMHLVRVLDFDAIRAEEQAGTEAASAWLTSMAETIQQAWDYLASVARHLRDRGFVVTYELREGLPVAQLLEVLREGDLAVVTTRGRGEFTRWLLDSVTDELIRYAPCPVLVARAVAGNVMPQCSRSGSIESPAARSATTLYCGAS